MYFVLSTQNQMPLTEAQGLVVKRKNKSLADVRSETQNAF